MKKFLIAVFTALALTAWVVPSMALDTVFDGQFRVRAIYINNAAPTAVTNGSPQGTQDASSFIDQRYRLGVKTTEGSISAYVQLQMGGAGDVNNGNLANNKVWGTDPGTGAIQVRQAYIEFPTGPISIKLGRTYVAHGFLGNGLFDNIVDRYAFTYKMDDKTVISFIHAKPRDGRTTGTAAAGVNDSDRNVYNFGFTHKMGDMGDAAARIYYVRDGSTGYTAAGASTGTGGQFNGTWLTAQTNLKFNPINLYVSGAYLTGEALSGVDNKRRDIAAYAAHVDVNSQVGPAKIGLISGYGSGDKNTSDDKLKTFFAPGPASYVHTAIFFQSSQPQNNDGLDSSATPSTNLNTQNGSRQTLSNVAWAGLYGDFKATDELTLSAMAAKFKQAQALSGQSKDIGAEVDLVANYKLQKGLALVTTAARFWPGKAFSNNTITNENISLLFTRLQWDF